VENDPHLESLRDSRSKSPLLRRKWQPRPRSRHLI
jgi:hypothetical protein